MIDKINVNGGYDYPNHNNPRKNAAVQAYENTPGTKEAAKQRTGQKKQSSSYANAKRQGVVLDLSSQSAKEESTHAKKQSQAGFSITAVLQKVFAPAKQAVHWMKNFWRAGTQSDSNDTLETAGTEQTEQETAQGQTEIEQESYYKQEGRDEWASLDKTEDLPPLDTIADDWEIGETGSADDGLTESIAAAQNEHILNQELKTADLQQIERLLTKNGTKHLAHNSDLLTYYDRKGMLVEMDETEKHRVLFGDKNVLKL